MEDPYSLKAASQCLQFIRQQGGEDAEYFAAIDERRAEAVLKKYGITWKTCGIERHRESLMGCFASHFLLWLKCIELDEPIMIFESDALCVRNIPPQLCFMHLINLTDGYYRRNDHICRPLAKFLDQSHSLKGTIYYDSFTFPGAVAYAISPDGARRLVRTAQTKFACESDIFIAKDVVNIVELHPLVVQLSTDFPSYIGRKTNQSLQGSSDKPSRS